MNQGLTVAPLPWQLPRVQSVIPTASALALILFGSRARGDSHEASDLDLLVVTNEGGAWHSRRDKLSVSSYSLTALKEQARNGSLFVCHIAFEAKPLFDPADVLGQIQNDFALRNNYAPDLKHAGDLGWYLVNFGSTFDHKSLARRMTWCTRTALIARSAEAGKPVFAPHLLAERSQSEFVYQLLVDTRRNGKGDTSLARFRDFLEAERLPYPVSGKPSRSKFLSLFRRTGNAVALQAVEQQQTQSSDTYL